MNNLINTDSLNPVFAGIIQQHSEPVKIMEKVQYTNSTETIPVGFKYKLEDVYLNDGVHSKDIFTVKESDWVNNKLIVISENTGKESSLPYHKDTFAEYCLIRCLEMGKTKIFGWIYTAL